jgi:hypothetical protein
MDGDLPLRECQVGAYSLHETNLIRIAKCLKPEVEPWSDASSDMFLHLHGGPQAPQLFAGPPTQFAHAQARVCVYDQSGSLPP